MSDHVEVYGKVVSIQRDKFQIQVENTDTVVLAQLSGKMRTNKIRITLGDRVGVRLSPFDLTHGLLFTRK